MSRCHLDSFCHPLNLWVKFTSVLHSILPCHGSHWCVIYRRQTYRHVTHWNSLGLSFWSSWECFSRNHIPGPFGPCPSKNGIALVPHDNVFHPKGTCRHVLCFDSRGLRVVCHDDRPLNVPLSSHFFVQSRLLPFVKFVYFKSLIEVKFPLCRYTVISRAIFDYAITMSTSRMSH
jgi:hypothetical protein